MKTTKLVIGILMIILSLFIVFQSMAAGLVNAIENKGHTSGSAGILIAIAYLISGIVYLATKKQKGLGGDIANAIILGLIGGISLANTDNVFKDLLVWIILGFIIGFGFLIWHILSNRKLKKVSKSDIQIQQSYPSNNYQPNFNQTATTSLPSRAQYRARHRK